MLPSTPATPGDGFEVYQDTHDDLNANANLQVDDTDVAYGNPVPVDDIWSLAGYSANIA